MASETHVAERTHEEAEQQLTLALHLAPQSRTHDISQASRHHRDLKTFARNLEAFINDSFFPNVNGSSYKEVYVLLLSWEGGDALIYSQLSELHEVFREDYKFSSEEYLIPKDKPNRGLNRKLDDFLEKYDAKNHLLIIYYGGHGALDEDRGALWLRDSLSDSPSLDWSSLQVLFKDGTDADVLMLLDCCAAAGSARSVGHGMVEVIAACGFENKTPLRGKHTFTANLIQELRECLFKEVPPKDVPAVYLHTRLINRLKEYRPGDKIERRVTPIHFFLAHGKTVRSIRIGRRAVALIQSPKRHDIRVETIVFSGSADNINRLGPTRITEIWPDIPFQYDRVLLAINLSNNISQDLDIGAFQEWLREVPAFVDYIQVEAVYRSSSTLLLVSTSIAVWDLLPDDPATTFIGFISSKNLKDYLMPIVSQKGDRVPAMWKEREEKPESANLTKYTVESWLKTLAATEGTTKYQDSDSVSIGISKSTIFSFHDRQTASTWTSAYDSNSDGELPEIPLRVGTGALRPPKFSSNVLKALSAARSSSLRKIGESKIIQKRNIYVYQDISYHEEVRIMGDIQA